jgi:16S rRNA C1402 (ribose-2'-O) methylase RsmI
MTILLDIDGVLVTTPSWRSTEILADGFMKFNEKAASNLQRLISETKADIVLTTTHRITYTIDAWKDIFRQRGILTNSISKLNDKNSIQTMLDRAGEIKEWFDNYGDKHNFVIIDDDLSINSLPTQIKDKYVMTKPLIGLDEEATIEALRILRTNLQLPLC